MALAVHFCISGFLSAGRGSPEKGNTHLDSDMGGSGGLTKDCNSARNEHDDGDECGPGRGV
jgi:hypothetical protein